MTGKKVTSHHRRKETIKCECGVEIDLVPNVKVLSDTIEDHVATHIQELTELAATAEAERVEDALIGQVFKKAIQCEDEKKVRKG
jgi:hypothetical protein